MVLLALISAVLTPLFVATTTHALPACPGQRFYLKTGEGLDIQFSRKPGCDVRFMAVERGSVERRLFYPSGRTNDRSLTAGQHDAPEAWTELPQTAFLRANAETVVRFLADRPAQVPNTGQQSRAPEGTTKVSVTLYNATSETVTHYWVDPSGREISYGTVAPGAFVTLNTFDRHVWRIKRLGNNHTIKQFTISPRMQTVRVDSLEPVFQHQPRPLAQPQQKPPRLAVQPQRPTQAFAPVNQSSGPSTMGFLGVLWSLLMTIFWLGLFGGLIYAGVKMTKSAPAFIISHWYSLIGNLQESPMEFYRSLEHSIHSRQLPQFSVSRVDWPEGGIFSPRREYLRVRRKDLIFDICGAPFGNGFFVSWWLGPKAGFVGFVYSIPVLGYIFQFLIRPLTYYKIDTALMFQQAVHSAVLEVIDGMTEAKGIRALTESERKPVMKNFFQGQP